MIDIDGSGNTGSSRSGEATARTTISGRMTCSLLFLCTLIWALSAQATEDNPGAWAIFSASGSMQPDNPWRYWFDAQHRAFDIGSGITQSLARPAIGLDLGQGVSVWLGYAYLNARRASGERIDEHRPWQQIGWTAFRTPGGSMNMRVRLEQRFLETGDDTGWTLRTQASYTHRLGDGGRWQAVAFLEPFVALNNTDWGADRGFAQNRTFLGAAYRISAAFSVEFGYMHQYVRLTGEDLVNHLAVAHVKLRP